MSIHRRLLDAGTAADLRQRAAILMSWPVATLEEARLLGSWGVDGMISERFEALAAAFPSDGAPRARVAA